MAKVNSVTVLAPNGRRQTVKVTPNSTVLQVLEEVCNKHDFDPQEYDIRHHSRVLDATMTVQFSRLPNNAQLEMVKAKKMRRETEVLVNVQTESCNRFSGSFLPSDSLWDVITKLCPDLEVAGKHPAVIYMRQEICGKSSLKATSLRSLGLTSGRALLRLMYKFIEEDTTKQSEETGKFISASKISSTNQNDSFMDIDPQGIENTQLSEATTLSESKTENILHHAVIKKQPLPVQPDNASDSQKQTDKTVLVQPSTSEDDTSISEKLNRELDASSSLLPSSLSDASKTEQSKLYSQETLDAESVQSSSLEEIFSTPITPHNRNPVVYKRGVQKTSAGEDLPDEFFELTLDDVRYLYRDLRNKRSEVDEAPLQIGAVKKLEESKRVLNNLQKYKRAVLRINFPDQTVLQGSFSSVETIKNVEDFVRGYLEDPSMSFHLYTTPPKEVLTPSDRLIEANCVPCAVLHFGVNVNSQGTTQYLRTEVLSALSSQEAASTAATHSRGALTPSVQHEVPSTSGTQHAGPSTSNIQSSGESKEDSNMCSSSRRETKQAGNPNGKVPKWFKLTPK